MNRTKIQIDRFLSALDIGIEDQVEWSAGPYMQKQLADGSWVERWAPWASCTQKGTKAELLAATGKLQHLNIHKGCTVFFRPPNQNVIYLDADADVGGWRIVEDLIADGIDPRAIVQTSTGNYQIWLQVPAGVSHAQLYCAAERKYGADPGAHPSEHGAVRFARLPGFRNTKRGKGEFVLLKKSTSKPPSMESIQAIKSLVADFTTQLEFVDHRQDENRQPNSICQRQDKLKPDPKNQQESLPSDRDRSRLDMRRGRYLAGRGCEYEELKLIVANQRGAELYATKGDRADDILSRVAAKAFAAAGRWHEVPQKDQQRYGHLILHGRR